MENKDEEVVEPVEESLELPTVDEGEEDLTDYKAEALKLRDKAIAQRERTRALRKELADTKRAVEIAAGLKKEPTPVKTGELDETQLDYLDLKGISEPEDIKVIEDIIQKTGMTVRQALKDDYVEKKIEANKAKREVKEATPSSTKRTSSGGGNDLALALAKFEQDGTLPSDFELRTAVIDAQVRKEDKTIPPWRRK